MEENTLTSQTPLSNPNGKSKLLLVGFLVVTLFSFIAGFSLGKSVTTLKPAPLPPQISLTPTPLPSEAPAKETDPTADWKTYTDTIYRYSIKYPPDAFISTPEDCWEECNKGSSSGGCMCNSLTINLKGYKHSFASLSMEIFKLNDSDKGKPTEYINRAIIDSTRKLSWEDGKYIEEDVKIDTVNARCLRGRLVDIEEGARWAYYLFFTKGDFNYYLVWIDISLERDYETTLNLILSTFKFLD